MLILGQLCDSINMIDQYSIVCIIWLLNVIVLQLHNFLLDPLLTLGIDYLFLDHMIRVQTVVVILAIFVFFMIAPTRV